MSQSGWNKTIRAANVLLGGVKILHIKVVKTHVSSKGVLMGTSLVCSEPVVSEGLEEDFCEAAYTPPAVALICVDLDESSHETRREMERGRGNLVAGLRLTRGSAVDGDGVVIMYPHAGDPIITRHRAALRNVRRCGWLPRLIIRMFLVVWGLGQICRRPEQTRSARYRKLRANKATNRCQTLKTLKEGRLHCIDVHIIGSPVNDAALH